MRETSFFLALYFSISFNYCPAQENENIERVIYLLGNTATSETSEVNLGSLRNQLLMEEHPYAVIHLGDVKPRGSQEHAGRTLEQILQLGEGCENGLIYFTPGDQDWDNAGRDGLNQVRELEKRLEELGKGMNIFLPSDGCPGPEVIDISPHVRVIAINTHWWLHPFDIPEAPDADCSNLTKEEFIETLEETIEESVGKNILIIGHHPVISAGVFGGHMTLQQHLFPFADGQSGNRIPIPVLGSFYAAYRQNVGSVRDMANEDYQEFIGQMGDVLSRHPGLIYASAHDYNLQLLEFEKGYQVVSGSINETGHAGREAGLLFADRGYGYAKLEYFDSGKIRIAFFKIDNTAPVELYSKVLFSSPCTGLSNPAVPMNRYYIPCIENDAPKVREKIPFPAGPVTVTGGTYEAEGVKRVLLGTLHRATWQTPVRIPYLNLDTAKSGLTPFALGGGRQTTTLKFRANDGKEYAFRSVDKNLVNALPREFRNTFVALMIREVTATEYPYGAIIASSLLDGTDILHARPSLYVLPDHPGLGAFRESYSGLFGMLEDRPKDPEDHVEGFMGADDVTRSVGLFRKLYRDNDYYVDAESFGKARVFDMLIGDWGRHEDNWKWAGYDTGAKRVYYPIPRDRDHAFCRWNGMLPYLADREWAMPMVESFDAGFHDIKSLTWPARHLDRFLLTDLDYNDWKAATSYIQQTLTDEVIDQSILSLPPEVLPVSGYELGEMLKSRRAQLPEAVDRYYKLLARQVDVVGSNKHELVQVERLETGNVLVEMYKRNLNGMIYDEVPLFSREFVPGETKEICIYGLDGADIFNISGTSQKSIPVRIIGGPGQDEISDRSSVNGLGKHSFIYDHPSTLLNLGPESKDRTSDDPGINRYDRTSYSYNTYFPKPLIFYSSDDGFVGSLGLNWTTHGFRKEEFKSKHDFYLRAGTSGNVQFGAENQWTDVIRKWDAGINADFGFYYPYYNFFGLGNHSVKDPDLFKDDYYKVYVKGLISNLYVENKVFKKGIFRLGLMFEDFNALSRTDSIFETPGNRIPGADKVALGGISARFYLDFRDRPVFATKGIQFLAENSSYMTLDGAAGNFGLLKSYLKYYASLRLLLPVTLVMQVGGSKNYGKQIPFYKYTCLGQFNNLRGYKRNRFTGDASLFMNSELRLHLGKVRNLFLPFETGLIGFYDIGKVWIDGIAEGRWHAGYGGGFYISPLTRDYLFTLMFESSVEEKLLFRFGMGFILDRV